MGSFTVRSPHRCNGKYLGSGRAHTGAVVLYDGFDEQARHEHMSDEYKDRYIIRTLLMTLPSVLQTI